MRKGSLVYDPFAGTGSILVAAGHLGAVTLGSDIDAKVIRDGRQVSSVWCAAEQSLLCCLSSCSICVLLAP